MSKGRRSTKNPEGEYSIPEVQNVVAFAEIDMNFQFDMTELAWKLEGARLNRKRFPAVVLRKNQPKSTVLCFKSGRLIIIGVKSEEESEYAALSGLSTISKAINCKLDSLRIFRITNIVANGCLGYPINIAKFSDQERYVVRNAKFPGVVYKGLKDLVKSILVFASGKLVFTGAKSKDDIDRAFVRMKAKLERYRLQGEKISKNMTLKQIEEELKREAKEEIKMLNRQEMKLIFRHCEENGDLVKEQDKSDESSWDGLE